jgi:hypothetical protein
VTVKVKMLESLISGKTAIVYPFAENRPADQKKVAEVSLKDHHEKIQKSTYVGPTDDAERLVAPSASIRAPMFRRS